MTRHGRKSRVPLLLLIPIGLLLGCIFVYPLLKMIVGSFLDESGAFSLTQYRSVFTAPAYLKVFWITLQISLSVTVATIVIGYPFAYVMATGPKLLSRFLQALVLVPFVVSLLVRTYAWLVILSPSGVLAQLLTTVGVEQPPQLLFNRLGVNIGMIYSLLPYMVFALFGNMRSIDGRLIPAASSLGAGPWRAFRSVYLPLTLPGVAAGSMLVFILSCGFFITPKLMGGPGDVMVGSLIQTLVAQNGRVEDAAAVSTLLLGVSLLGFLFVSRVTNLRQLFESRI